MTDDRRRAPAGAGIYRAIQWLLFLDVVLGLVLAVIGEVVLEARPIAYAGLGLAVIGLLLMVFFRGLAAREAARRDGPHGTGGAGGGRSGG